MKQPVSLHDISIRTELRPGDLGYVTYMHGALYKKEYNYGISFEAYVAEGLCEFYHNYDPAKDCVWIGEHDERIIAFLLLMHRPNAAQLRYFIIDPAYRGVGLGNKLMELYIKFLHEHGYSSSYLWTTDELPASAHLYKKFGFFLTEEKPSDAFGKELKERRYELEIK